MRVLRRRTNTEFECEKSTFVAEGGEGAVYADGDVAVKIYQDQSSMIPEGKIAELAAVATPDILAPLDVVLENGRPVGYEMLVAEECLALPKIYPRSWRKDHGLDPSTAMGLVLQLRKNYAHIHGEQVFVGGGAWTRGSYLVVDGNDMNFLVRTDFSGIVHIDVDSYQTPGYPPTAIMPSVRDPRTKDFNEETDWYTFALVAFSLMIGIHPFKGGHPDYAVGKMLERMKDGASALTPGAQLPKPCMPFDVIPATWRTWFEGVFHHGDRSAPPTTAEAVALVVPKVAASPATLVELSPVIRIDEGLSVVHAVRTADGMVVALSDGTLSTGHLSQLWASKFARLADALGVTQRTRQAVAFWKDGPWLKGYDVCSGEALEPLMADAVTSSNGLVHYQRGASLMEIKFLEHADPMRMTGHLVASVAPKAVRLFPGVAIQGLLGATWASMLPKPGRCVQVRLKEIEGQRILDAQFVGGQAKDGRSGVLKVAVDNKGNIDVHTWHGLWAGRARFELHEVEEDVGTPDFNLVELDTGTCVSVETDGTITMFKPGTTKKVALQDDVLANARLFTDAGTLLVALDDGLYSAKMRS